MTWLSRYKKSLAGLLVGVATAVLLLPTDADPRLLALIPLANLVVVALAPRNAPPETGIISSKPTTYVRPALPSDPLAEPRPPGRAFGGRRRDDPPPE